MRISEEILGFFRICFRMNFKPKKPWKNVFTDFPDRRKRRKKEGNGKKEG